MWEDDWIEEEDRMQGQQQACEPLDIYAFARDRVRELVAMGHKPASVEINLVTGDVSISGLDLALNVTRAHRACAVVGPQSATGDANQEVGARARQEAGGSNNASANPADASS